MIYTCKSCGEIYDVVELPDYAGECKECGADMPKNEAEYNQLNRGDSNMSTLEKRVSRAVELYPFIDEFTLEDVFSGFDMYRKEITLPIAFDELKNYGFDESEVINFLKLWRESDENYKPVEVKTDPVMIAGEELEFIAIDTKAMAWGRGDSLISATAKLSESAGDFLGLDSDSVQVYLVSKGTSVTGTGSFSWPHDATDPMRIK